jgi:hypothetical protein
MKALAFNHRTGSFLPLLPGTSQHGHGMCCDEDGTTKQRRHNKAKAAQQSRAGKADARAREARARRDKRGRTAM